MTGSAVEERSRRMIGEEDSGVVEATITRRFVDGPHGQIHLREAGRENGASRPIVLLHMFPQSSRNFEPLMRRLGNRRHVLAPDVPGFGESSPPGLPLTVTQYAQALWLALEGVLSEDGREIDLFAVHAGTKLAVRMAAERPDRVSQMVLASPAIFTQEELGQRSRTPLIPLDREGTRFRRFWGDLVAYADGALGYENLAAYFAEMIRASGSPAWWRDALDAYNAGFAQDLAQLRMPVAVLNPADDLAAISPRAMRHLTDAVLIDRPGWSFGYLSNNAHELAALLEGLFEGAGPSLGGSA